jgi:hypothetical protein
VQSIWLLHNTQLPVADAAGPLLKSYKLYNCAAHGEWWTFFRNLYGDRDWRPTAYFLVELPFEFLSHGNLLFAASGATLACTCVTCLYVYCLLRLALEPWAAVLGSALLGLLPGFQWPSTEFAFTEGAFLPAVLATVYHLIRSRNLSDVRHSIYFVLAITVAFMMRPVESLTHIAPVLAVFLLLSWRHHIITASQIYSVVAIALVSASILILMGWLDHGFDPHSEIFQNAARGKLFKHLAEIILTLTLLFLAGTPAKVAYSAWRRDGGFKLHPPYIIPVFTAICVLVTLFYLKSVTYLVEWTYEGTVGDLSQIIQMEPKIKILRTFMLCSGFLPLAGITLLGVLSFCFCLCREQKQALLQHPLLYLTAVTPLAFLLTMVSVQFYPRRITIVFCAYLLTMLVPVLTKGRWRRLRIGLVALIAVWQFSGVMWISTAHPQTKLLEDTIGSGAFPAMVTMYPNPNDIAINFMIESAKRHGYKKILIPLIGNGYSPVDIFTLQILMQIKGNGVQAAWPFFATYNQHTIPDTFAKIGADAFLVVPDRPISVPSAGDAERFKNRSAATLAATDKMAYDLLALYAAGKLESTYGVKKSDCTMLGQPVTEVCLFEFNKTQRPVQ